MSQTHPHTLEYKVVLLRYLLGTKEWLLDPNPTRFWEFIGDTFKDARVPKGAPKLSGKELEEFCDGEAALWQDEKNNPRKKRRKGYEADSEYDELMGKWVDVWHEMSVTHWTSEMEKRPTLRKFDLIPAAYRDDVKKRIEENDRKAHAAKAKAKEAEKVAAAAKKTSPRSSAQKKDSDAVSRTEDPRFEYDGEKLRKVVDAARERACQVGKYDLAAAVQQIYQDALLDMSLRILLEAILTQRANEQQNAQFQDYVRKAKRKLKDAKEPDLKKRAMASLVTTYPTSTPPATVKRPQSANIQGSASANRTKMDAAPDSAYASGRSSDKSVDGNEEAAVKESSQEARKRRRESITSSEAAEADLEEAERASKRRRGEDADEDNSGTFHPRRAVSSGNRGKTAKGRKKRSDVNSRESSPLSEAGETDIEAAKEAYVDEMVRRRSAEASRKAIEDEYGPVSPTVADDASWKSMPSPTLRPTRADRSDQAQAGAQNTSSQQTSAPVNAPAPPPPVAPPGPPPAERLTPAESSHAFQIISGAAAEAVQPAIDRLEGKIDALLSGQGTQTAAALLQGAPTPANGKAPEAANTSRELVNLQELIRKGELESASPEVTKLITQLARNAAEASIHAAETARRAGEMARDVSLVLLQLGTNKQNQTPPNEPGPSSRTRRKQ